MRDRAATAFCQNEPNFDQGKRGWPSSELFVFAKTNPIRPAQTRLTEVGGNLFVFARTNPIRWVTPALASAVF